MLLLMKVDKWKALGFWSSGRELRDKDFMKVVSLLQSVINQYDKMTKLKLKDDTVVVLVELLKGKKENN